MCPGLNRRAARDPSAIEKLVVRLLPRPSGRTLWVGDVVAFNSPLGKPSDPAQVSFGLAICTNGCVCLFQNFGAEIDPRLILVAASD